MADVWKFAVPIQTGPMHRLRRYVLSARARGVPFQETQFNLTACLIERTPPAPPQGKLLLTLIALCAQQSINVIPVNTPDFVHGNPCQEIKSKFDAMRSHSSAV